MVLSTVLNYSCGISDSDNLLPNRLFLCQSKEFVEGLPKLDQSLESIAPLCTGCLLVKFDRRPFRPTSKKGGSVCEKVHMGNQRSDGYDVHRKTSLLSDISRRLFGTDSLLTRSKRNRISQILKRICRKSLNPNR
jgi:hypothetical protein